MSFLAPLYAAGLLAISLPIIFHLIRRTPRGRVAFSSLMFLSPSPPRVTRRSRLENLWLLLLRGLAICLLAFAFTRPFFRDAGVTTATQTAGEQVVILVDQSASMQREDLWKQAVQTAVDEVGRLEADDRAAVYAFDTRLTPLVSFSDWDGLAIGQREAFIKERLKTVQPSWRASHLDTALTTAVEALQRIDMDANEEETLQKRVVLIGDVQRGSRVVGLRGFQWPEEIPLSIKQTSPQLTTNAGLQIVAAHPDQRHDESAHSVRARVYNAADSARDRFRLAWADADADATAAGQEIYVPAGQSRIIKVAAAPPSARACLQLAGDDHAFDNSAYHVVPQVQHVRVLYVGDDAAEDPQRARYYLQRALPETAARRVTIISSSDAASEEQALPTLLAVVMREPAGDEIEQLQQVLAEGGTIFYGLTTADSVRAVSTLADCDDIVAEEAAVEGYAMLGDVQFDHPLFASFSEARYSDFTKIHFWKHRTIDETALPDAHVLARFDDGAAALLEIPAAAGRILLLTTSWNPTDSQLALSSKFAPLLNAVVEQSTRAEEGPSQRFVGEEGLKLAGAEGAGVVVLAAAEKGQFDQDTDIAKAERFSAPGIYEFNHAPGRPFSVNIHPDESRTEVLPVEQWEQWGIPLSRAESDAEREHKLQLTRQLQNRELEQRQKLWQWLIFAAAIVLLGETWLAGRTAAANKDAA